MFHFRSYLLTLLACALTSRVEAIPQHDAVALCASSPGQFKCLSKTKFVICNGASSVAQDVAIGTECVDDAIVRAAAGSVAASIAAPSSTTSPPRSTTGVISLTKTTALTSLILTAPLLQTAPAMSKDRSFYTTKTLHSVDEVISVLASFPSQYPPAALTSISNALQPTSPKSNNSATSTIPDMVVTLHRPQDIISLLASNISADPSAILMSISSALMPQPSTTGGTLSGMNSEESTLTKTVRVTGTTTVYLSSSRVGQELSNISALPMTLLPAMHSSARTKRPCKPALPNHKDAANTSNIPSITPQKTAESAQSVTSGSQTSSVPLPPASTTAAAASATKKIPVISTHTVTGTGFAQSSNAKTLTDTGTSHASGSSSKVTGSGAAGFEKTTSSIFVAPGKVTTTATATSGPIGKATSSMPQDFASPTNSVSQNKVVPISV